MTKQEIAQEYEVKDGIITSPGKFEGEPDYTVHFYDLMMNGDGENWGMDLVRFTVTPEDKTQFPALTNTAKVSLWEDSQGFVCIV